MKTSKTMEFQNANCFLKPHSYHKHTYLYFMISNIHNGLIIKKITTLRTLKIIRFTMKLNFSEGS